MALRFLPALLGASLTLAACHGPNPDGTSANTNGQAASGADLAVVTSPDTLQSPVPSSSTPAPDGPLAATPVSCADELGATAAERRAKICRNVSPATHPPCNVSNSCAMIDDEIARSCAQFDGDGAPMAGCTPAPKSQDAAVAVINRYYAALNARDYDTAWRQWGDNGPPNQTMTKFAAGFASTRATHVTIGALEPAEGGAGSIYQTVPVVVDATLDNGAHQRFRGDYVVRRVNGVDGASPAQLRWHIDSAHLTAVKAP